MYGTKSRREDSRVLRLSQNIQRMLALDQEMLISASGTAYVVPTWPFDLLKERKAVGVSFAVSLAQIASRKH